MQLQVFIATVVIFITLVPKWRAVASSKEDDRIVSLPTQPPVSFQQYSGYVTIDEHNQRALFYYLVEAETDPTSKPLLLWFNGGPGSSSIGYGAFGEHGPFKLSNDQNLVTNEYSWNKVANMLYLESPAGVGFSYSANTSFYDYLNDTITAKDNLEFLQRWFLKFPEYRDRDFYVAGESYGAHYVIQLANLIVETGLKINFKGISVGNPLLDYNTDLNSRGEFYWSHGLVSEYTYELLKTTCNFSQLDREYRRGQLSSNCELVYNQIGSERPHNFNDYCVTADICQSHLRAATFFESHHIALKSTLTSHLHSGRLPSAGICLSGVDEYLNKKEVQDALHAKLVGGSTWSSKNQEFNYDQQNQEISIINVVASLIKSHIRVLIYSGDQDSTFSFIGTRKLVNRIGKKLGLNTTTPYKGWLTDDKQVGGWIQIYGDVLTFSTIKGGCHATPASSPKETSTLLKAFLSETPLI